MRKIANLKEKKDGIVRVMIYNDEYGTYLFGFKKMEDCGAEWDEWYETEKDALESCETEYGIKKNDWTEIPNPEPNCQHDRIKPYSLPILDYGTLNATKEKLAELGKTELHSKIERILKSKPVEKPTLHNKKKEIETNNYRVGLDNESVEIIIDLLADLEVNNLDENYEPKSNLYSNLLDKWNSI